MATTRTKEKSPEFENDELLALAKLDLSKENIENALLKIKMVLADSKTPDEAHAMAAKIYAQLGLHERAQTHFKAFLERNPDAQLENFQMGMTYFDAGNRKEALKVWAEILQKQPKHPPALFYTGLAQAQEGDATSARKTLGLLIQSAPADNLYFNQGKELLGAIERGDKAKTPTPKENEAAGNFLLNAAYGTEH